jgi:benzaldehyde dehydrogenase (NAD)
MGLIDLTRMRNQLLVGAGRPARHRQARFEPGSGEPLDAIPFADADDVDVAVARLSEGQRSWAATAPAERSAVLRRAGTLMETHSAELAEWLVREAGATRAKAAFELMISTQALHSAAGLALEPTGELYPSAGERLSLSRRVPVGVVGVIAPFNAPLFLAMRAVAPALALGNAVIVKPDPRTPISGGTIIASVLLGAGLPESALAVLPGGAEVGAALTAHPGVPVLAFTGSTDAGRKIAVAAAGQLKRVHLELGGNSALIVFEDADLELAASAGAWGAYNHAGQICMASSRLLVHEAIADDYVAALVEHAERLSVGDPRQASTMIGPLIDERQRDAVHETVMATVAAGATLATGGHYERLYYTPTVLSGVVPGMAAYEREIFGPVAPVSTFASFEEAVQLANGTTYGLSAGVLSADLPRAQRFAERLRTGNVHINDQTLVDDGIQPFGGVGDSGNGSRIGSTLANRDAFTEQQWLTIQAEIPRYPF